MTRRVVALLVFVFAGLASAAHAQTAEDKAAAETLFREGRALMEKKQYTEACARFVASQALDPALGTVLNLADCYEKNGQTASAWATFDEAAAMAKSAGDSKRHALAKKRGAALASSLSRLTVALAAGAQVEGLVVRRDGQPLAAVMLGVALPLDPGRHLLEASAPGRKPWSRTVDLPAGASTVYLEVPVLEVEPPPPEPAPPEPAPPEPAPPEPAIVTPIPAAHEPSPVIPAATTTETRPRSRGLGTRRWLAIVAGGAGLVAAVVGSYFALDARGKWNDSKEFCDGTICNEQGYRLAKSASDEADQATLVFIVAGVAVAGGVYLWVSAPSDRSPETPKVALGLRGSF